MFCYLFLTYLFVIFLFFFLMRRFLFGVLLFPSPFLFIQYISNFPLGSFLKNSIDQKHHFFLYYDILIKSTIKIIKSFISSTIGYKKERKKYKSCDFTTDKELIMLSSTEILYNLDCVCVSPEFE